MSSASVTVDKQLVSSINRGVLVFAAVGPGDTRKDADTLATKLLKLKMWPDESGANVISLNYCCQRSGFNNLLVEEKRPGYPRRSAMWYAAVPSLSRRYMEN